MTRRREGIGVGETEEANEIVDLELESEVVDRNEDEETAIVESR